MPKPKMTTNDLHVLRNQLVEVRDALGGIVKNARVTNDEDEALFEVIDDETELVDANVGDTVKVAPIVDGDPDPDSEVLGEIVELVEVDGEAAEPETTENARPQYRRIKNCKVLRTTNGAYQVLCPIAPKATTNAAPKAAPKATANAAPKASGKRYVRLVTNKRCQCNEEDNGGHTPKDMQGGVKYVPAFPMDEYATVIKNIRQIDEMLTNATVANTTVANAGKADIKKEVKEDIDEALKESGIVNSTSAAPASTAKRYIRTQNYRTIKNSETGLMEVVIDMSGASDMSGTEFASIVGDTIADANVAPITETLPTPTSPVSVDVVVDGVPVASTENAAITTHNEAMPFTSAHPALQPFIAANEDLRAMLALAQFCEDPVNAGFSQAVNDVVTLNSAPIELYGDASPLEVPTLFPAKK